MIIEIHHMRPEDIAAAVDIETASGLKSRGSDAYLNAIDDPRSVLLVAKFGEQVVGIFSGLVVIDELQIDNVAVKQEFRLQGIGEGLLFAAIHAALDAGAETAVLEVRSKNIAAISLYRHSRFKVVGRRVDYYQNPVDDALIMSCNINEFANRCS